VTNFKFIDSNMKKVFKYLIVSVFSILTLIIIVSPNDPAWVACSDEKDLYRYVYEGWKVDKVLKSGDITYTDTGQKMFHVGADPQIYLIKDDKIKVLNFGWRCYYLEGAELNYKKK
jgi:hypothetical protein